MVFAQHARAVALQAEPQRAAHSGVVVDDEGAPARLFGARHFPAESYASNVHHDKALRCIYRSNSVFVLLLNPVTIVEALDRRIPPEDCAAARRDAVKAGVPVHTKIPRLWKPYRHYLTVSGDAAAR
jgi:hypothetical protein